MVRVIRESLRVELCHAIHLLRHDDPQSNDRHSLSTERLLKLARKANRHRL